MSTNQRSQNIRWLIAGLLVIGTDRGAAADSFDGPYVGVDLGRQKIIGGAPVAGINTLRQGTRSVASVIGGYRHQFPGGAERQAAE